jgi:hypothetical protein
MTRRKTVDSDLIMSFDPCEAWPEGRVREAVPERVSLVEFLRAEHIPPRDRLWVALHRELLSDRLMRLFACDCAERALIREREAGVEPDERSWNAVAVARWYAVGEATDEELEAASDAAWDAPWSDALSSASDAAREAAGWVAYDAAWRAAWTSAWAASLPARAAASDAAREAASVSEHAWQIEHLLAMIEEDK